MHARCPRCSIEVNADASVCPACKVALAVCAYCRDLTSLTGGASGASSGAANGTGSGAGWGRARYTCDRCGHRGASCRTALLGGYCNGLTRADGRLAHPLCAGCAGKLFDSAKMVAAWTLIGLLGARLRPRS